MINKLEELTKKIKDNAHKSLENGVLLCTLLAVSMGAGLYLAGKQTYNGLTSDFKMNQSSEETSRRNLTTINGSVVYGYDRNKDGRIDLIKEYWVWYGAKAAAPCKKDYTPKDKEFEQLERQLIEHEEALLKFKNDCIKKYHDEHKH